MNKVLKLLQNEQEHALKNIELIERAREAKQAEIEKDDAALAQYRSEVNELERVIYLLEKVEAANAS